MRRANRRMRGNTSRPRATATLWVLYATLCCFAVITEAGYAQIVIPAPGIINTLAGNGTAGFSGDGGLATGSELDNPRGLAVDAAGNIYIADLVNNRIREVAAPRGTFPRLLATALKVTPAMAGRRPAPR